MRFQILALVGLALLASPAQAQNRSESELTLIPEPQLGFLLERDRKVDPLTGLPVSLYGTDFVSGRTDPIEQAWDFLNARGAALGIERPQEDLIIDAVRETPGGYRVRFRQVAAGLPVFRSGIAVSLDHAGRVVFVVNDFKPGVRIDGVASKSGAAQALAAAADYLGVPSPQHQEAHPVIYAHYGKPVLAQQVRTVTPNGSWEVLVDANSGEVFRAESLSHFVAAPQWSRPPRSAQKVAPAPAGSSAAAITAPASTAPSAATTTAIAAPPSGSSAEASALVYDPDPMTTAQASYGATTDLEDNGDATNATLDGLRTEVTLRDVTFNGTTFELSGPNVVVTDFDPPFLGTFGQASDQFHFDRSQPAFEAVMVYHHLDQSMRYINEDLGYSIRPLQYSGGVQVDPHGLEGAVNAQYLFTGQLRFGEGGVDMAEDPDVILHEFGHAVHDWITNRNLSQGAGLGEGSADYWAASYTRGLGLWSESDSRRDQMGRWGGRPFFVGRTVDYFGRYPFDLTGAIHTDGQIWATAVIEVWDQLGKRTTDMLFLEALSMLGNTSNTEDAARALVTADSLLNGGANAALILDTVVDRGFLFRAAAGAVNRSGPAPLNVTFFDLSTFGAGTATSWSWDLDGDGQADATGRNPSFTYTEPGLYDVTLTASNGARTETTVLKDYVSVNSGVYVWQGLGNGQSRSGAFIAQHLERAGVEVHHAETAVIHPSLAGYDAVFLSFGPYEPQNLPTPLLQVPARVIRQYVASGGRVYLEGGDVLGFDQSDNTDLLTALGIQQSDDGDSSRRPVRSLVGQDGSLAAGVAFSASNQTATTSVDRFTPNADGQPLFVEDGYGIVAVQGENAGGGRSVVMSYTLADLVDDGFNSRGAVLNDILDYFGIVTSTTSDAQPELPASLEIQAPFPNPFEQSSTIRLSVAQPARITMSIFDILGRERLKVADDHRAAGTHEFVLDAGSLPPGTYFVRITAGEQSTTVPITRIR